MTLNITRRNALKITLAASALSLGGVPGAALAANGDFYDIEKLMNPIGWVDRGISGSETAKATLIEYSSPSCPHCALFHTKTLPRITTDLIETGKTRYILRPFVLNILDAVVYMLADAAGEDGYQNVLKTFFETQSTWSRSDNPKNAILEIALQLGFTEDSFEKALTNQELFAGMEQTREQASSEFGLTGTPTFYINGKMFAGNQSFDNLADEIIALQG